MPRILLTRPEASLGDLTEKLQSQGHDLYAEPLLRIEAVSSVPPFSCHSGSLQSRESGILKEGQNLPFKIPGSLSEPRNDREIQAVLFSSINAISFLASHQDLLSFLRAKPCFCVGDKTAEAARQAGLRVATVGETANLLAPDLRAFVAQEKGPLLHIRGEDISATMEEVLQALPCPVLPWVLYRAVPAQSLTTGLQSRLQDGTLDVALFFSTRTAQVFVEQIEKHGLKACCQSLSAIGISEGVCASLAGLPWQQCLAPQRPTQEDVIKLLNDLFPFSEASP